jgi:hypothetical protein
VRKHLQDIRIVNPVAGCGFTSANRARRFVAQGRAVWIEPEVSIRFVQSDHRHRSAGASLVATRYWYDRATHSGMAQLAALANLPMIAPAVALGLGARANGRGSFPWPHRNEDGLLVIGERGLLVDESGDGMAMVQNSGKAHTLGGSVRR